MPVKKDNRNRLKIRQCTAFSVIADQFFGGKMKRLCIPFEMFAWGSCPVQDEVRFMDGTRSAAWINYSYQIVENQATFVTVGEEQTYQQGNATESEGDEAIEEGMGEALTGHTVYEETQILLMNETNQSLGRYDRIAVDDDQVFPVNYVTDGESAQNQDSLDDFVWPYEITISKSYSQIVTLVNDWIEGKLN